MGSEKAEAASSTSHCEESSFHNEIPPCFVSQAVSEDHHKQIKDEWEELESLEGDSKKFVRQDSGLLGLPDSGIAILLCRWQCGSDVYFFPRTRQPILRARYVLLYRFLSGGCECQ